MKFWDMFLMTNQCIDYIILLCHDRHNFAKTKWPDNLDSVLASASIRIDGRPWYQLNSLLRFVNIFTLLISWIFLVHVTIIVTYSIILKTKRQKKLVKFSPWFYVPFVPFVSFLILKFSLFRSGSFLGLNLCRFYQTPKKLMKFSISGVF